MRQTSLLSRIARYKWLFALGTLVFLADQATKSWVFAEIPFNTFGPPGHIEIIPGFFNLVHVGNTGAAWSMFAGSSMILALLAGATLVAIFVFRRHLVLSQPAVQTCFGLLCGGILGNLVDRLIHGHVIDFLDFRFGSYIYPTFNIADSGIVVGVILYLIVSFKTPAEN
ncbi:MAG TPA: signal peptidase II [Opitutaceae bacterium]|nr:signal peptidase II [Opitutaceae bacterium]